MSKILPMTEEGREEARCFLKYKGIEHTIQGLNNWVRQWQRAFDPMMYAESNIIEMWCRIDGAFRYLLETVHTGKRHWKVIYEEFTEDFSYWMEEIEAKKEMLEEEQKEREFLKGELYQ